MVNSKNFHPVYRQPDVSGSRSREPAANGADNWPQETNKTGR